MAAVGVPLDCFGCFVMGGAAVGVDVAKQPLKKSMAKKTINSDTCLILQFNIKIFSCSKYSYK